MKYEINNPEIFEKEAQRLSNYFAKGFIDNKDIYYEELNLNLSENKINELFEEVKKWDNEEYEDNLKKLNPILMKKSVVQYILSDHYIETTVEDFSKKLNIDLNILNSTLATIDLIMIDYLYSMQLIVDHKEEIKVTFEKNYELNKNKEINFRIIFNLEKIDDEKFLLSPFISSQMKKEIYKIPGSIHNYYKFYKRIHNYKIREENPFIKTKIISNKYGEFQGFTKKNLRRFLFSLDEAKKIIRKYNKIEEDNIHYIKEKDAFYDYQQNKRSIKKVIKYDGNEITCYFLISYLWDWKISE